MRIAVPVMLIGNLHHFTEEDIIVFTHRMYLEDWIPANTIVNYAFNMFSIHLAIFWTRGIFLLICLLIWWHNRINPQIARFMGPRRGPPGPCAPGPCGPGRAPCWPHEPCNLGLKCRATHTLRCVQIFKRRYIPHCKNGAYLNAS